MTDDTAKIGDRVEVRGVVFGARAGSFSIHVSGYTTIHVRQSPQTLWLYQAMLYHLPVTVSGWVAGVDPASGELVLSDIALAVV